MDDKTKKEIAREYLSGLLHGGWDDEMMSVNIMKKYKLTPEEYVQWQSWFDDKIREMFEE